MLPPNTSSWAGSYEPFGIQRILASFPEIFNPTEKGRNHLKAITPSFFKTYVGGRISGRKWVDRFFVQ
jgi:hypothetical protein